MDGPAAEKHGALDVEVLVIGGGTTGLGVLRDALMRGYTAALVEQGDLAYGTSGRFHGLLHSGARYVVTDPESARECIDENIILRNTAAEAIEDTGGLFIHIDGDDPEYAENFLDACARSRIAARELDRDAVLAREPNITPHMKRAFHVPDAAIDSFRLCTMLADDCRRRGGEIFTYHKAEAVHTDAGGHVTGVTVRHAKTGETRTIGAAMVVNATGPWGGRVAELAGARVSVRPSKGIMVITNHRLTSTVVNRCRRPGDGDILVPIGTVSIIGTTSTPVDDPDELTVETGEIEAVVAEGAAMVPALAGVRLIRAYAGARPLYDPGETAGGRAMSRSHGIIDHRRDGIKGFLTVVGGKLTTFRLMAEHTVDAVEEQLGRRGRCTTAEVAIEPPAGEPATGRRSRRRFLQRGDDGRPGAPSAPRTGDRYHTYGGPWAVVEMEMAYGQIICECEYVTRRRVEELLEEEPGLGLDDVRRRTRLGMGPCQGGFCSYRGAALLFEGGAPAGDARHELEAFLQRRWRGIRPLLYGDHLKQSLLDLEIYRTVLHLDGLAEQ